MIKGEDIERLVQLLFSRSASVYHACQFSDLQSYLQVGGIPSRAHLEAQRVSFTSFETDDVDQLNCVWDKVFLNLSDFGKTFAGGHIAVPNPYGPILLQINPVALHEASDVAICLRSAGASGFSRENEALPFRDIDRLFNHPVTAGSPRSEQIKYRSQLQQDFGYPGAADPEISCTVLSGRLSIKYVNVVWVDHYVLAGKPLRDWVNELKSASRAKFPVRERKYKPGREAILNELASILTSSAKTPSLQRLSGDHSISQDLRDWSRQLLDNENVKFQFPRFAKYLREGTLLPLTQPA